ncbi:hypothetical protein BOX15_Mlig032198g2, partial [Macrostomum lignano]
LLFEDSLVSVSEQGKQLGEYKMSVEKAIKFGDPCLLVTASSHGLIDNVPCGTSISCYVTFNLETIEQRQHEYVKLENHPLDRRVDIVRCDEGLRVTKNVVQGERKETASKVMPYGAMEGFISEGANLLLQRLLITKIFPSFFDVLSFDSDSNLCQASYTFLGEKSQLIGGQPVQVLGVQRVIQSMTDVPTSWQTYFFEGQPSHHSSTSRFTRHHESSTNTGTDRTRRANPQAGLPQAGAAVGGRSGAVLPLLRAQGGHQGGSPQLHARPSGAFGHDVRLSPAPAAAEAGQSGAIGGRVLCQLLNSTAAASLLHPVGLGRSRGRRGTALQHAWPRQRSQARGDLRRRFIIEHLRSSEILFLRKQ